MQGKHLHLIESISEIQEYVPDISALICSRLLRQLAAIRGMVPHAVTQGIRSLSASEVTDWLKKFEHDIFAEDFATHLVRLSVMAKASWV